MIRDLSIALVRSTDDVPAMIEFLTALGLRLQTTSERIDQRGQTLFAASAGRSSRYVLHATTEAAQLGRTHLVLGTNDLDGAVAALRASGRTVSLLDEESGRAASVATPRGDLRIDDTSSRNDVYGHPPDKDTPEAAEVLPVLFADTVVSDGELVTALGFTLHDEREGAELWEAAGGGKLLLHPAHGDHVDQCDWSVAPGIRSDVDPDALVDRLRRIGCTDARLADGAVQVTDPDGQHVEVHPMPSATPPTPSRSIP
jgi:hypothetical protein